MSICRYFDKIHFDKILSILCWCLHPLELEALDLLSFTAVSDIFGSILWLMIMTAPKINGLFYHTSKQLFMFQGEEFHFNFAKLPEVDIQVTIQMFQEEF